MTRYACLCVCLCVTSLCGFSSQAAVNVAYSGSARLRTEHLHHPFRISTEQTQQALVAKTSFTSTIETGNWYSTVELMDSRVLSQSDSAPIGVDDINTLEPLQFKTQWLGNVSEQGSLALTVGRMTVDVGSRRLMARNRFRNTVNSFAGIHALYRHQQHILTGFLLKPVTILPEADAVVSNARATDTTTDDKLAGFHYALLQESASAIEMYGFYSQKRTTEKRFTLGGRINQPITPTHGLGFELEGAYQFGDMTNEEAIFRGETLRIAAFFLHASIDIALSRNLDSFLRIQGDIVSGDNANTVNKNEQFDTLYGANRFEFGPTGIYGFLKRKNILSPGLRWIVEPSPQLSGFIGYRYSKPFNVELDAVPSHSHQLETKLQYQLSPHSTFEVGGVQLFQSGQNNANSRYFYTQLSHVF